MINKIIRFILRHIAPGLIILLGRSIRWKWENREQAEACAERGESVLFCFWHNRFLMMPYVHRKIRRGKSICVMASRSRDGQFITDVLHGLRFTVARGSSSRSGDTAMREMAARLKSRMDSAVTPDGPRGPLYRVQPGVVLLSQLSGAPIIPVTYDVTRKKRIKSWDRFIVPLPFCRGSFVLGNAVYVPGDADEEARGGIRKELEAAMRSIDRRAAEVIGVPCD